MPDVQFRVSSALKTIIGKELITDDFIAVFELVKNSFDAQARRVDITFDALGDSGKIVIQDDGHGMNRADIIGKWLFVAYSEKKALQDYRDKIKSNRIFAGAKGIGRFSCDRLGEKLKLYSKKKDAKGKWHILEVDWRDFETDVEQEFQDISASYSTASTIPYNIEHGTIVEITGVRDRDWDRDKLLRLRRSLERLINPNQENDSKGFQIYLHAPQELEEDREIKRKAAALGEAVQQWELVNGPIRNFLLEALGFKTTQVQIDIDALGETIKTRLEDRGVLVYELIEVNPFKGTLHDIRVHLFSLNRSAKLVFTKRMGVTTREYGSVFLYKNGFRVHPFGDPGDDTLAIDTRHSQNLFRTLGTRDLSGRIEINGLNPGFQETSSRDGGLIGSRAYTALKELVLEVALKRLETFVIDISKFWHEKGELPDPKTMSTAEVKRAIFDIINKQLARSKDVIEINYDPSFINVLENRSAESVSALLKNLKKIAAQQNSPSILKEIEKAERQLEHLAKAKAEAEAAETRERERAKKAESAAREAQERAEEAEEEARRAAEDAEESRYHQEQTSTQNVFLRAALSKDLEHVLALHHSIGQDALVIDRYVGNILAMFKDGATPRPEEIRVSLERISYVTKRISAITRFATQANHRAAQKELLGDLVEYIREYLLNIYQGVIFDRRNNRIPITFGDKNAATFITNFTPIDVSMVFDNLINNAKKHGAKNIHVEVAECTADHLALSFSDDGVGIPKKNLPHIFQMGFSTTDGSGLGLHHVQQIMREIGGAVEAVADKKQGAEFILRFPLR